MKLFLVAFFFFLLNDILFKGELITFFPPLSTPLGFFVVLCNSIWFLLGCVAVDFWLSWLACRNLRLHTCVLFILNTLNFRNLDPLVLNVTWEKLFSVVVQDVYS